MTSLPSPTFLSLEKKRARDRRAQRNFRHRKNAHISMLESELSACREQMMSYQARIRDLESTCSQLGEQNVQLLKQHPQDGVVRCSWQTDVLYPNTHTNSSLSMNVELVQRPPHDTSQSSDTISRRLPTSRATKALSPSSCYQSATDETGHALPSVARRPSQDAIAPPWSLTPPQGRFMWDVLPTHSPWGGDLRMALESPDFPSPLELLYGSRTNKLANIIHDNTRLWRCREPERLAGGWLAYAFAKWMAEPSKPRFERLPEFLRPVPEQLRHAHPVCIDGVVFRQLRINLIYKPHLYDLDEVLGMLSCCLKVRWPWGKNFLTPSDGAELHILPEFYNTFMSLDGWGLTEEFIHEYPELLDQMDVQNVHYEVA
ncbi:hypothetical protein N7474_007033 [Penicillium riverlandense]|uniref:uncharacterized protein n=1 Tax=Penicillium riverlandense TaxID=1903569 RepID=UPI0025494288|nr:uncharacterized protein N7474_007033 [Penicillium riverlandense]KAJ5815256.1 hypothetical protein N7474_007033 [Penicillium riverlandense]